MEIFCIRKNLQFSERRSRKGRVRIEMDGELAERCDKRQREMLQSTRARERDTCGLVRTRTFCRDKNETSRF